MALTDCKGLVPYAQAESARTGIPPDFYLSIAYSESNCTGYHANGGVGYFGVSDPNGVVFPSGAGGNTPPLAVYPNPQDAFAALSQLLVSGYPNAVRGAQQGNFDQFVQGLVEGGYASPSDVRGGWIQNITNIHNQITGTIAPNSATAGPAQSAPGQVLPSLPGLPPIPNPISGIGSAVQNGVASAFNGLLALKASFIGGIETVGIGLLGIVVIGAGILIVARPNASTIVQAAKTGAEAA